MLLKLRNVGRLNPAEVKIEGLTVICGNNNTGKSTIGKILYCIFTAFYDIEKNIRKEKEELILQYIWTQMQHQSLRMRRDVTDSIQEVLEKESEPEDQILRTIEDILIKALPDKSRSSQKEIIEEIQRIIQVNKDAVVSTFLKRCLETEFEGRLGNVNHPKKKTEVDLAIKDQHISFSIRGTNETLSIESYISLEKQIIYLDGPYVLDYINDLNRVRYDFLPYGHSSQTISKIRSGKLRRGKTAVEEVLRNQKLKDIIDKINQISDGEMTIEDGKICYRQAKLQKSLGISNLSTGVKTFLTLKELLLNGDLEENGIMVIDEPEVHLHPEWQIKYAEIIVLLQKAYGLNIVLTTHSLDFLSALITFAKEYGIEKSCNYYLTELKENDKNEAFPLASLNWMNNDIQGMYSSVSEPFEKLYQQMDIGDFDL